MSLRVSTKVGIRSFRLKVDSPDGSFPGLQLIHPMYICRSLSLKRKNCEKAVTTHMESKLAKSKLLMFASLWSVVCLRANGDVSQGETSSGESTFGRNDRTEFLRAQLCYLRPLSILFPLNNQGTDDCK